MDTTYFGSSTLLRFAKIISSLLPLLLFASPLVALPWTPLVNRPAGNVQAMLLMSDGTVMAQNQGGNAWYRLTPVNGSYVNGSWTTRASMVSTRTFYTSVVMVDGRVLVAGAEYGSGWGNAEVYDSTRDYPGGNPWTPAPVAAGLITTNNNPVPPNFGATAGFSDSIGMILPNGNVLVGPVYPFVGNGTIVYTPGTNTWSAGPTASNSQNEASWLKLADSSILVIDKGGTTSERYIPATNTWIADRNPPAGNLYDGLGSEIGAALLLPDGRGFFLGATGRTALYTPSGSIAQGSWVAGPNIPNDPSGNAQGAVDAPAAMMVNGKILCAVSRAPYVDSMGNNQIFNPPTRFYEYTYDPAGGIGSFSAVLPTPTGAAENVACFQTTMLDLPDGTVLYSNYTNQLYTYSPVGSPLPAGKPTISSISANSDGSYHLIGTNLNGISAGATYGDDSQMDSNYPLVRLIDSGGNVRYGRTFNWSSTGVRTGNTPVSTEFTIPDGDINGGPGGPGTYYLAVVANGISSDLLDFGGPVWVDFNYNGVERGSFAAPYKTLHAGLDAASLLPRDGRTIHIKGPGSSPELFSAAPISIPVTIISTGGSATVGQ